MGEGDIDHGESKLGRHHPDTHTRPRLLKIYHLKQSDILIACDHTDLHRIVEGFVAMDEDEFLSLVLYFEIAVVESEFFESFGISCVFEVLTEETGVGSD
jgi:hypothetical protein